MTGNMKYIFVSVTTYIAVIYGYIVHSGTRKWIQMWSTMCVARSNKYTLLSLDVCNDI